MDLPKAGRYVCMQLCTRCQYLKTPDISYIKVFVLYELYDKIVIFTVRQKCSIHASVMARFQQRIHISDTHGYRLSIVCYHSYCICNFHYDPPRECSILDDCKSNSLISVLPNVQIPNTNINIQGLKRNEMEIEKVLNV